MDIYGIYGLSRHSFDAGAVKKLFQAMFRVSGSSFILHLGKKIGGPPGRTMSWMEDSHGSISWIWINTYKTIFWGMNIQKNPSVFWM
jgi:hypothetical protein